MDEDVERELVDAYPQIFSLYDADPEEIEDPVPTFAIYGFECGNGWKSILESLCETITRKDVELTVVQVKEKFGMLRFYHDGIMAEDDRRAQQVFGAIQHAQEMSGHICEECGHPGTLHRDGGWLRTRCEDCHDESQLPSER